MSPTPQSARDVPKKTTTYVHKETLCFAAVEPQKNVTSYVRISYARLLLIDGGTVKKVLGHSTSTNKSNDLEPHFPTSATKPRCLEDTTTAAALPQCSESTKESIAGWWTFGLEVTLELYGVAERLKQKKNGGRGASSCGFVRRIGPFVFFWWAMQHR